MGIPLAGEGGHSKGSNDPAVEEAFRAVLEGVIGEILDGRLHETPWPGKRVAVALAALGGELHRPFRRGIGGPGGWEIVLKPEVHLGVGPDKVVPDLAGWRVERIEQSPRPGGTAMSREAAAEDAGPYSRVAPDWVCEVLSPATEALDRGKKMRIYRREGVKHAWLVNPNTRTLEVYRLQQGQWILVDTFEEDSVVRAEPFDAVELSLGVLWET